MTKMVGSPRAVHSAHNPKRIKPSSPRSIVQGHSLVDCERLTDTICFVRRAPIRRLRETAEEPQLELEPSCIGLACPLSCYVAALRSFESARSGGGARE